MVMGNILNYILRQNSAFVRIIPLKWVILRIRYLYLCHVSQMEKMCAILVSAIFLLFAPNKEKHSESIHLKMTRQTFQKRTI